jgi:EKC/KEOPS complex subunit CGI121/TPRKB
MFLQTLRLEHIPLPHAVHVAAFTDVTNASYLRDQLLAGNSDFEYAFIDASAVSDCSLISSTRLIGHS